MLRVTLEATTREAVSLGIKTVWVLEIFNDGTGTHEIGQYVWRHLDEAGAVMQHGRLEGYPRDLGAVPLVRAVLQQIEQIVMPAREGGS